MQARRALLLLIAAGCTPASEPARMRIDAPSAFSFVPERLPDSSGAVCVGAVPLDGPSSLVPLVVVPEALQFYRRGAAGWTVDRVAFPSRFPRGRPLGCEATDLDADGDLDVVVAGPNSGWVAWQQADGSFRFDALPAFPPDDRPGDTFAIAAIHADGDELVDLYVARGDDSPGSASTFLEDGCVCDEPRGAALCGKDGGTYRGGTNFLLRNAGGAFVVASATGAEDARLSQALGVIDVDRDGRQDLVVADDAAVSRIFRAIGDGTFEDRTEALGLRQRAHGMGVAAGDLDGDGLVDLALSQFGAPLVLKRTAEGFTELGAANGLGLVANSSWGIEAEDFDADGDLDLLVESEGDLDEIFLGARDCHPHDYPREELLLLRNDGHAHFTAEAPLRGSHEAFRPRPDGGFAGGRALAAADVDRDGVLDAVVVHFAPDHTSEAWFLRGRLAQPSHALTIAAPQGAWVEVCVEGRCRAREVPGTHSFQAMHPRELYFALGAASEADVTIEWPKGTRHEMGRVPAGFVTWRAP